MDKTKEKKVHIPVEEIVTQRRSERNAKRKAPLASEVDVRTKNKPEKTVRKRPASEKSPEDGESFRNPQKKMKTQREQLTSGNSGEEPLNKSERDLPAKKRNKKKKTTYEIDCSRINLNVADFQKELWRRAKDGKFKSVKNIRMKISGKTISITTRSYIPKKCIRSNVYFVAKIYLKKKNIDRPIHIVGDKNVYQLAYK